MKIVNRICIKAACLAVMFLLFGCVGEERPRFDQSVVGYMEYRTDLERNVLIGLDTLSYHAPEFDDLSGYPAGSRWMIYCRVEQDDLQKGYKEVTLNDPPVPFLEEPFRQSSDTLVVQENESPVQRLKILRSQDRLYAISQHLDSVGQQQALELFYTEKESPVSYNDCNVYGLYLRSYRLTAPTDTLVEARTAYTTFDLSSFLQAKKAEEKAAGNAYFYVSVKYLIRVSTGVVPTGTPYSPPENEYLVIPVDE